MSSRTSHRRRSRETAFLAFWRAVCPQLSHGDARALYLAASYL